MRAMKRGRKKDKRQYPGIAPCPALNSKLYGGDTAARGNNTIYIWFRSLSEAHLR